MIRKILLVVALAGASATAGAAAPSWNTDGATLSVNKGTVLVSNGSQFVTAKPGQVVKPGARVMVMQGGSASLNYANGRSSMVPAGTLAEVGMSGAATFGAQSKIGSMYAQAPGADPGGSSQKCGGGSGQTPCAGGDLGGGYNPSLMVGGFIVAFAGIYAAAGGFNGNSKTNPASP
jgi:hypothetical protein